MLGRVIMFIITFTAMDIINLRDGIGGYIQHPPGMLCVALLLMGIPALVFGLKPPVGLWVIIILEVVYIAFYTWVYFKIKEERKNNKK